MLLGWLDPILRANSCHHHLTIICTVVLQKVFWWSSWSCPLTLFFYSLSTFLNLQMFFYWIICCRGLSIESEHCLKISDVWQILGSAGPWGNSTRRPSWGTAVALGSKLTLSLYFRPSFGASAKTHCSGCLDGKGWKK